MVRILSGKHREDRPLGDCRVLDLVDHRVGEARRDFGADVSSLVQKLVEGQEDIASIEVSRLGEDAVVGGAELSQLGLGRV
jgi:ribosome-binding protein aMBF1 (putative translation factor)